MQAPVRVSAAPTAWRDLYRLGGACALALVALIVGQLGLFLVAPPPLGAGAEVWFRTFQAHPLQGLLAFEALMVVYVLLSLPLAVALTAALWQTSPQWAGLALLLTSVAAVCFVDARPGVELLHLASAHAQASSDEEKAMLLAAGEATLARFGGTAFHVGYLLGAVSGLFLALALRSDPRFGPRLALLRASSSVLDLGLYLPVVGTAVSASSVLVLLVWHLWMARRLFGLAATLEGNAAGSRRIG